jgi:hypothetical protein
VNFTLISTMISNLFGMKFGEVLLIALGIIYGKLSDSLAPHPDIYILIEMVYNINTY